MRTTESRNPVSVPVKAAAVFDRVKATRLSMAYIEGVTRLQCRFEATDGETILPGHSFSINIDNLENAEQSYPKLKRAMDNLAEVLGLYYKQRHVTQEIEDAIRAKAGISEIGQLSVIRDAVESDLRQAVPIIR